MYMSPGGPSQVSDLYILDNNIFHNLYFGETYIFTDLYESAADMTSL